MEKEWHVISAHSEAFEVNYKQARTTGQIHIKYKMQNYSKSLFKKVKGCKIWPNIHQFQLGNSTIATITLMNPDKVELTIKRSLSGTYGIRVP
jgi:hypothetical protein